MGIKSTAYNGQRRVFFVFDRGTRKFPGNIDLWMQSLEYTRQQKAHKRLTQILTNVLRLHPTKPELWVYAAQFAMDENGDVSEARSYMQRGLRFCKTCRKIWLQYTRLELAYMTKLLLRRQVLGIGKIERSSFIQMTNDSEDILRLSSPTAEDIDSDLSPASNINPTAPQAIEETSEMSNAILVAIFDAAMSQFKSDATLGHAFFDLIASFDRLPVIFKLLDYVIESLSSHAGGAWQIEACRISRSLVGISPSQPEYPTALRGTLQRIQDGLMVTKEDPRLVKWCEGWLQQQIREDMDIALQRVLQARISSLPV